MELFKRFFKKNSETTPSKSNATQTNKQYEQLLEKEFKLRYGNEGWSFESDRVVTQYAEQLTSADICLMIINKLRDQLSPEMTFNSICILAGNQIVIVCNSKPEPLCIMTKLNSEEIAQLIVAVVGETSGQVNEYKSTWLLKLPERV